jgi:hypothetical protein
MRKSLSEFFDLKENRDFVGMISFDSDSWDNLYYMKVIPAWCAKPRLKLICLAYQENNPVINEN